MRFDRSSQLFARKMTIAVHRYQVLVQHTCRINNQPQYLCVLLFYSSFVLCSMYVYVQAGLSRNGSESAQESSASNFERDGDYMDISTRLRSDTDDLLTSTEGVATTCDSDDLLTSTEGVAHLEQEAQSEVPLTPANPSKEGESSGSSQSERLGNFSYKAPKAMTSPVKSKTTSKISSEHPPSFKKTFTKGKESVKSLGTITSDRVVKFDLEAVTARLRKLRVGGVGREGGEEGGGGERRFRAKIAPSSNAVAEEELRKEIR